MLMPKVWKIPQDYPKTVLSVTFLLTTGLTLIALQDPDYPSFKDPLLGFEARGTNLANRINTWNLLIKSHSLTRFPSTDQTNLPDPVRPTKVEDEEEKDEDTEDKRRKESKALSTAYNKKMHFNQRNSDLFCGRINEDYIHFVLTSEIDLLEEKALSSICRLDYHLLRLGKTNYTLFQEKSEVDKSGKACVSWSLPNYIAALVNKSSCFFLTQSDIDYFKGLVSQCLPNYQQTLNSSSCLENYKLCGQLSPTCSSLQDKLFDIFHYILDKDFFSDSPAKALKRTSIFLPIAKSTKNIDYYQLLKKNDLTVDQVSIVAMDLGIKVTIFEELLIKDLLYVGLAFIVIYLSLYFYTQSLFVATVIILLISAALTTSYFIYRYVYGLSFFPFMNILALIISIGIGSDNALIYCKYWNSNYSDHGLAQSSLSTFLASLTTAIALFIGYLMDITAIKCFSIFSGTVVLVNFILFLLCLPAALSLITPKDSTKTYCHPFSGQIISNFIFQRWIIPVVIFGRSAILLILSVIGIGAFIVIFVHPRFSLPIKEEIQLLHESHPFELYDAIYKDIFWFNSLKNIPHGEYDALPLRMVFGIEPVDNGFVLDPYERGSLTFKSDLDLADSAAQEWIISFCRNFRSQSFYKPTYGPMLTNCLMETVKSWLEGRLCYDSINKSYRYPCCNETRFPYPRFAFQECLFEAISLIKKPTNNYLDSKWAGVWFDIHSNQPKALIVEYYTNFSYEGSFSTKQTLVETLNQWNQETMKSAPKSLGQGWSIADNLEFYALQESMITGIKSSILALIVLAIVAIGCVTRNFWLTLVSLITISFIVFTTIAALVLLDWKLNIIESVIICISIGLSVDYTLHYSVSYQEEQEKSNRALSNALSTMGPPILMASATTLAAGLLMKLSSVDPYLKIGTFMIVISTVNWIYSTFFFWAAISLVISLKERYFGHPLGTEPQQYEIPLEQRTI